MYTMKSPSKNKTHLIIHNLNYTQTVCILFTCTCTYAILYTSLCAGRFVRRLHFCQHWIIHTSLSSQEFVPTPACACSLSWLHWGASGSCWKSTNRITLFWSHLLSRQPHCRLERPLPTFQAVILTSNIHTHTCIILHDFAILVAHLILWF